MNQRNSKNRKHLALEKDKKPYTAPALKPYGTLLDLVRAKGGIQVDGEGKVSRILK